jgi:hypothetical protein
MRWQTKCAMVVVVVVVVVVFVVVVLIVGDFAHHKCAFQLIFVSCCRLP